MEEALYDSMVMRQFVGIDLGREPVPDETTVCKFRHLLEEHGLTSLAIGNHAMRRLWRLAGVAPALPLSLRFLDPIDPFDPEPHPPTRRFWVRARGVSHRDESGNVVALTGTHQDITEMRLAEVALQDQVVNKDIPDLLRNSDVSFTYALAKGRGAFYGMGITSARAGYYLSYALPVGGARARGGRASGGRHSPRRWGTPIKRTSRAISGSSPGSPLRTTHASRRCTCTCAAGKPGVTDCRTAPRLMRSSAS